MLPTIRLATLDDLPLLERLEQASFPDFWTRESLHTALAEAGYLVLVADEIGFILGWSSGDEAEIARVGVLESARGQGIGAALVERALQLFQQRSVASVFLEVRADNEVAIRLYQRAQFQDVGFRKNYYRDGQHARVMKRELEAPRAEVTSPS